MNEAYLRELLGGAELPEPLHRVLESSSPHPLVSQAMPPKLFRLLDESCTPMQQGQRVACGMRPRASSFSR